MAQTARLIASPLAAPGQGVIADDMRRSFLRMVSHELRTPLNAIIGFSEILGHELCGPLGAPQYREYAQLIGDSGHRLLRLINQILEIVRLESGDADLDLQRELLAPLVQAAFGQMQDEAAAAGVRLDMTDGDGVEGVVDARALGSVLANLLQNAITHSPPGGLVTVRVRPCRQCVIVEVQDQGLGVAAADLDRIMRPFEQAEHALTRSTQGAGLGLPIARLLCDAMNGSLELSSAPGRGLTAQVTLPAP